MTHGKTVLVLGGGIGGTVAATTLRRMLPREHRVILVERESRHVFSPSFLWVMIGRRSADQISRPMAAAKRGIELIQGTIERIDPAARSIRVDGKELSGDYLVIALGADLTPKAIPGLAQAGHNFYSLSGAQSLREARLKLQSGKIVVLVSAMPFKCPGAPNEAAMLLEYDCRKRGVRNRVSVDLYTAEPGPMPVAGAAVSRALRQMIESKGIGYHPDHAVTAVDPAQRRMTFANGASADFDLLAYVPPHRAPIVVRDAGLCAKRGWVPVDRGTLETKFPGVYALGDVTGIMLTSINKAIAEGGRVCTQRSRGSRSQHRPSDYERGRGAAFCRRWCMFPRNGRGSCCLRQRQLVRRSCAADPAQAAQHDVAPREGGVREALAVPVALAPRRRR